MLLASKDSYCLNLVLFSMKIGVCGIACEACPKMRKGTCPNGEGGCVPKRNEFCKLATCAFERGFRLCFDCPDFPCDTVREGPIDYSYCRYLADLD